MSNRTRLQAPSTCRAWAHRQAAFRCRWPTRSSPWRTGRSESTRRWRVTVTRLSEVSTRAVNGAGTCLIEAFVAVADLADFKQGCDLFALQDAADDIVRPLQDRPVRVDRETLPSGTPVPTPRSCAMSRTPPRSTTRTCARSRWSAASAGWSAARRTWTLRSTWRRRPDSRAAAPNSAQGLHIVCRTWSSSLTSSADSPPVIDNSNSCAAVPYSCKMSSSASVM
ncbi:hypothetical protein R1CP_02735 [Rhodococcus opacus]|uniref:Uncharacterized protein n=1 Tax=Rhodococcus opacus TaxID=37919 RepID=A0A1B1JY65_RHOOP|nr:hypothetical protein R1CP_02735 [Rhodococcus opacus]